jgi:hypothetical protein
MLTVTIFGSGGLEGLNRSNKSWHCRKLSTRRLLCDFFTHHVAQACGGRFRIAPLELETHIILPCYGCRVPCRRHVADDVVGEGERPAVEAEVEERDEVAVEGEALGGGGVLRPRATLQVEAGVEEPRRDLPRQRIPVVERLRHLHHQVNIAKSNSRNYAFSFDDFVCFFPHPLPTPVRKKETWQQEEQTNLVELEHVGPEPDPVALAAPDVGGQVGDDAEARHDGLFLRRLPPGVPDDQAAPRVLAVLQPQVSRHVDAPAEAPHRLLHGRRAASSGHRAPARHLSAPSHVSLAA